VKAWGFAISQKSQHKEIAADVISYLTSATTQAERAQGSGGFLPTRASTVSSLCSGKSNSWYGCLAYSDVDITPPSHQTGVAFANISTYFSTWMNAQYSVLYEGSNIFWSTFKLLFLFFFSL